MIGACPSCEIRCQVLARTLKLWLEATGAEWLVRGGAGWIEVLKIKERTRAEPRAWGRNLLFGFAHHVYRLRSRISQK